MMVEFPARHHIDCHVIGIPGTALRFIAGKEGYTPDRPFNHVVMIEVQKMPYGRGDAASAHLAPGKGFLFDEEGLEPLERALTGECGPARSGANDHAIVSIHSE